MVAAGTSGKGTVCDYVREAEAEVDFLPYFQHQVYMLVDHQPRGRSKLLTLMKFSVSLGGDGNQPMQ